MTHHARRRIPPSQVTFGSRWRGLDPEEVYAYLGRLADELESALRAESAARAEAERNRQGLRQWQSRHARCWFVDPARRTPNRGPW
ncbi:DivIVA domain-containing protein [Plantactinospora sp. S1510]|uniref:DivIVA domain-containing protein n=1 Tax=Plantactinospora alkalitolerans TaxID=2789879 RepID=A0ABS0H7M1_9ACTN|nr:DivIVA domain-containing protein [Plantactinospora alkalitolerans]MBF9134477.1 DivIVA domain-containing protein [Plantactinospora alkalitolerans]